MNGSGIKSENFTKKYNFPILPIHLYHDFQ